VHCGHASAAAARWAVSGSTSCCCSASAGNIRHDKDYNHCFLTENLVLLLLICNVQVYYATGSAHADAKGILQLAQQIAPAAALLVHGEPDKMAFMSNKIQSSLGITCFMPKIGEEVEISSSGCTPVPTSAQLLRKLPMSVQQLLGNSAGNLSAMQGVSGHGESAGAAAAGWLQQGDVGQLVQAALRLAGLNAAAAGPNDVSSSSQTQQQQQQQLPVSAAARAAQLAPWLELLAAAAHEVRKGPSAAQQPQQQQQQQQEGQHISSTHEGAQLPPPPQQQQQQEPQQQCQQQQQREGQHTSNTHKGAQLQQQQQQQEAAAGTSILVPAELAIATLSRQLHQQLALESNSSIIDGVLVVRHLPPKAPAEQQLVQSMQLLPAQEAAASLGLANHTVRLKCRIKLPSCCWSEEVVQRWLQEGEINSSSAVQQLQQQQQQQQCSDDGAVLRFVAAVLRTALPAALAQQVQQIGAAVQLRSIRIAALDEQQRGVLMCSWQLHDDALAHQCVSLVELAAKAMP
jgi:hypothetical protein